VKNGFPDGVGPERFEGDLLVVRRLHPVGPVLGTEVQDEDVSRAGQGIDVLAQEGLAALVEPVQILEQRDPGLVPLLGLDHPAQHADHPAPACVGIDPQRRPIGIGRAEEVEDQGQHFAELLVDEQQAAGDLLPHAARIVSLADAEVGPEGLHHR
jgi:hypothetical protein